ncbi:phosphoribosylglycinamide formyltransferase [Fulvivirgaceae bacterium BMA10]|uniref:Phosphoribosylglycinamide formyltransferase n=1 Tax=Splendidivirga corallicola TaxID=3051826 RepID=A0ABT8KRT8_9BACT|nr:phosphoribosylglycinamide formyltransferase [Fulvivirgaceae bacterium BMA10]
MNLAIFASGSGSNAEKFFEYFRDKPDKHVSLILTNKQDAFVIERAKRNHVPFEVFNRQQFYESNHVLETLKRNQIDLIVLAGFLWKVPDNLIEAYPNRIINIHPALLPKFGGKGMYGKYVHQAVIEAGEEESGITIHYVNQNYDEGKIIFQVSCKVIPSDTPETLAKKVQMLEHEHYPKIVEKISMNI